METELNNLAPIPGMIKEIEQKNLYALARQCDFSDPNAVAVEFGTFFGRSTACIAAGIKDNPTVRLERRIHSPLVAIDSFSCARTGGGFAYHVLGKAQQAKIEHLLHMDQNKIDFKPIFDHYLASYLSPQPGISIPLLLPVRSEITNLPTCENPITLMHIDAPKFYQELHPILLKYFPCLILGGIVIFQDFFYHWSASLIACIAILIREGFLIPSHSVASSLVCVQKKPLTTTDLIKIDQEMQTAPLEELILLGYNQTENIEVDKADEFRPRALYALAQFFFEKGRFQKAQETLAKAINTHGLSARGINNLLELIGQGFSVRQLYETDHSVDNH